MEVALRIKSLLCRVRSTVEITGRQNFLKKQLREEKKRNQKTGSSTANAN